MPHDMPADLSTLTATRAARLMREGKLRKEALRWRLHQWRRILLLPSALR
jgi:hypothetical protein